MRRSTLQYRLGFAFLAMGCVALFADDPPSAGTTNQRESSGLIKRGVPSPLYQLGAGDEIKVQQANAEELDGKVLRIDAQGFADLPMAGRLKLGGLTVGEAQSLIASKLSAFLLKPDPIVSIEQYHSQPVSVLGEVTNPGVIQLQGQKTLIETISMAGGLRQDAGSEVEITRRMENGRVPGGQEHVDASGQFSVAKIDLTRLMSGRNPGDNVMIMANDVVSVARSEVIYVSGDVHKPGGFQLGAHSGISVLQAVSLAEGLGPQASAKHSLVFRPKEDSQTKEQIPVDVASILKGKTPDFELRPDDILFIPDSTSKKVGVRAAEAVVQAATGLAVWRIPW